MPTTLAAISNAAVKVRWHEPYASESLNRKFAGIIPPGVYRGLKLATSISALSVEIQPDPTVGDHVAVQESETGFSTTYTDDTSGVITVSLSAYSPGDIVIMTIVLNYATGVVTTAEFRGYTLAEYTALSAAAQRGLLILGTVLRPASGTIPSSSITHDRRQIPFQQRTDEATPWNPLIRNGSFELGETNGSYRHASPFWKTSVTNANFLLRPVTTESRTGAKSLELTTSVAGTVTATIDQDLWIPVIPGRFVMCRLFKKVLQAATSSPSGTIHLVFGDSDGVNDVSLSQDLIFVVSATDASFVEVHGIVPVPATARVLKAIQIVVVGTYAAAAPCIRFDDVQAWAQVDASNWLEGRDARSAEVAAGDLFVGLNSFANNSAKMSFDGTSLNLERRDEDLTKLPPAISVQARTLGSIEYTLVFQSLPAGVPGYRKYVSATGRLYEVVNASYNNSSNLWTKDITGTPALKHEFRDTGMSSFSMVADTPWADGSWIQHLETNNPDTTTLSNPKFAPRLMTRDVAGNKRVALDHNGLRAGRVTVLHQNWLPPMDSSWTSLASGSGTNTIIFSDPNIPGPAQQQFVNASGDRAGAHTGFITSNPMATNQLHVIEWELSCTDLAGTPALQWQGGFMHDESGDPSSENYAKFSKTSASANWFLNTQGQGTGAGSSDTGIAATGLQRFRLEYYGSGLPGGLRCLGYINGVLVAQRTANMPDTSQSMTLSVAFKATGIVTNKKVIVSPITYTVARYLSDDSL